MCMAKLQGGCKAGEEACRQVEAWDEPSDSLDATVRIRSWEYFSSSQLINRILLKDVNVMKAIEGHLFQWVVIGNSH